MKIAHHTTVVLGTALFFVLLVTHDSVLYPASAMHRILLVGLLRLALIAIPVALGFLIVRAHTSLWVRAIAIVFWIVVLPYTIYSTTEIRHVAKVCSLYPGHRYTAECLDLTWTLLPTFIYAFVGTLAFVFTVSQISTRLFPISWKKQIFILALCIYTAFASMFGLYSRFNVWHMLVNPREGLEALAIVITNEMFFLNTLLLALFFAIIYFFTNRFIKRANKLLRD